ncbi:MAG: YggS family pyridoxal phosphate-dependent enzyme [Actinomycetia bacterium]|nr:YggS family pyridoxal phosphate-dependent enzyme [Actinomycetes bacterium]
MIGERIEAAGGNPDQVTLVAVTKAFPFSYIQVGIEAGLADLGENYAQELAAKAAELTETAPDLAAAIRWHFIGGLQRNKVKLLAGTVALWHSVDRESLVDEIAKRSPGDRILVQVNTTAEDQKSGCSANDAVRLVDRGRQQGLIVAGLMTVGPTSADTDPRPGFAALRDLGQLCEVDELSMGMSGDFELAIQEGSTMVRIGSALFGSRPVRE